MSLKNKHSKKSDYVGNHGGAYTDIDGMSRQFTYVDHDKKSKIASGKLSEDELTKVKQELSDHTERKIAQILALPAVNIRNNDGLYEEFIIRDSEKGVIRWHEEMVKNTCRINSVLMNNLFLKVWRNTVREQFWFDDLTHEQILAGEWKGLM